MTESTLHPDSHDAEDQRLEARSRYVCLDPLPAATFDRITALAATHFQVPTAVVSLLDGGRIWFTAGHGLNSPETDRLLSLCDQAAQAPQVPGGGALHTCARAPLLTPDGHVAGHVCLLSDHPREPLSDAERVTLQHLAALVVDELELRLTAAHLARQAGEHRRALVTLHEEARLTRALLRMSALLELDLDPLSVARQVLPLLADAAGLDGAQLMVAHQDQAEVLLAYRRPGKDWSAWAQVPGVVGRGEGLVWRALDSGTPLYVEDYPREPGALSALVTMGLGAGVWVPLGRYDGATYLLVGLCLQRRRWQAGDRTLLDTGARSVRLALQSRERARQQQHELLTDPLTRLGNRRALQSTLAAHEALLMAVVDLNDLKAINDHHGHARGDDLLRLFASSLSLALPPGARAFRVGGDEFVLVQTRPGDRPLAEDGLLTALDAAVQAVRRAGFPTAGAAVGVASQPDEGLTPDDVFQLADERMYAHKRRQKERLVGRAPAERGRSGVTSHWGLSVSPSEGVAWTDAGRWVMVPPIEAQLLAAMLAQPGTTLTDEILTGRTAAGPGRSLEAHIGRLRDTLTQVAPQLSIRGQPGQGYSLEHQAPQVS